MTRKLKKGYYVKGQFIAEGSEADLAFKLELKGSDAPSRTELKRESDELQELGEALLTLRPAPLMRLALSEKLLDAVAEAKRISNFEGKRRQMQFIGKLMRKLEPQLLLAIRAALQEQHSGSAQESLSLHQGEAWRDRLIAEEGALAEWLQGHPGTDVQQLRALIRQARKDAAAQAKAPAGEAPRHGRSYRELFQLVREQMQAIPAPELPDVPSIASMQ
ncbi:MAG: ribosome biogenesis factor YjgA [Betaproteobacteria bacterium]